MRLPGATALAALVLLAAVGCGDASAPAADATSSGSGAGTAEELYPDVTAAVVTDNGDGTVSADVTVSSPYDTPERYADGIRVRSADGEVYGESELGHDHASEQPFTRSIEDVQVPAGVTEAVVEGRDQVSGWGGGTVEVTLPG